MSSRALRKAQQRAEEERLAALAAKEEEEEEEEGEEEDKPVASKKQANLFAMLNAELEEQDADNLDDDDDAEEEEEDIKPQQTSTSSKKKKNKKKKKKGKGKAADLAKEEEAANDEDIDAILQSLRTTNIKSDGVTKSSELDWQSTPESRFGRSLRIDSRHLDQENEMRKLFGRTAVSTSTSTTTDNRMRGQPRVPSGRPLLAVGGRRNVFVQPADNWPREGSGGLSMELLDKKEDGVVVFKYAHSRAYQDVQRQFLECVRSMDPERMITHMHSHPYHISTLLQVSHIASTQSNDHNTSQQLISRALYSMGRSSHSVFPTALASGNARLSFNHFENRELFFAGWKYVTTLSRRGLWRTGLEFVRMLLQFDPESDPLCLYLLIDQYALKSRTPEVLIDLFNTALKEKEWSETPSLLYSKSLAHFMAGDRASAITALKIAIEKYPWMMTKLHGSLADAPNLPQKLWGLLPPSETDSLLNDLYIQRMGDLWNIPENATFLTSAVQELADKKGKEALVLNTIGSAKHLYTEEKMKNLARHVFLMDPSTATGIIGYLPRQYREDQGYAWDILPPTGHESVYQQDLANRPDATAMRMAGSAGMQGGIFEVFLRSLLPSFQAPPPPQPGQPQQTDPTLAAIAGAAAAAGIPTAADGLPEGQFEVGEEELQAAIISMVEEGVGFPPSMSMQQRALAVLNIAMVPNELRPWFSERFDVDLNDAGDFDVGDDDDEETPLQSHQQQDSTARNTRQVTVEDGDNVADEAEEVETQQRNSQAIDRLVQILGTGDRASLRMRVDRMFEGQGAEMADVKRRVEERLGLR